jgi:regulator-associated protein of mTOR
LSIGIFPYVCKLLLSPATDLKATLIFIWARILAVDKSCQVDLLKDNGYTYFVRLLQSTDEPMLDLHIHENSIPEHRSMCAFILAVFCKDFRQGQIACQAPGVMQICLKVLKDTKNPAEPLMRHWTALLISQLWNDFPEAKWQGIREGAPLRLVELLHDHIPEVRVAALVALTTFIGAPGDDDQTAQIEMVVAVHALSLNGDGSSVVRKELVIFLSKVVARYLFLIPTLIPGSKSNLSLQRWSICRKNDSSILDETSLKRERALQTRIQRITNSVVGRFLVQAGARCCCFQRIRFPMFLLEPKR